jgi:hypothetical protein
MNSEAFLHLRRFARPTVCAITLGLLFLGNGSGLAALLKQAEVTAVVNDVNIVDPTAGERKAKTQDVIQGERGVKTGIQSRAELLFQDKTLTRLGANTVFSFNEGSRDMELARGTMLLQCPKGAGGAKIRTAAVTAAITGTTILLEYSPAPVPRRPAGFVLTIPEMTADEAYAELQHPRRNYTNPERRELQQIARRKKKAGHVKICVLEGTLRLFLNNRMGESVLLTAGQMYIGSSTATVLSSAVSFDIAALASSSLLVNNSFWPATATDLNMALIQKQVALQSLEKSKGDLIETNLVISGGGTLVLAQVDQKATAALATEVAAKSGQQGSGQQSSAQSEPSSGGGQGFGGSSGGGIVFPPEPPVTGSFPTDGSTALAVLGGPPPPLTPGVSGNSVIASSLAGTVPVLPTEGSEFFLYSNAGVAENSMNRTATRHSGTFALGTVPAGTRQIASLDYRVLTNEINTSAAVVDKATITISNGLESIELAIDRDILQLGGGASALTPVALAGVGGFAAGTDWLSMAIDVTPFAGTNSTITFQVWDVGDSVVDSALAIDNIQTGPYPAADPASPLPGTLTMNLNSVVLGSGAGEFRIPNLEGLPARDNLGPAANAGTFNVNSPNGITLNGPLNVSTGLNGSDTTFGGRGGAVQFNSANETIAINSTVKVSEHSTATGKASAAGGKIGLNSGKTTGVAININNTGELLALLNAAAPGPGGRIEVTSAGGDIQINGKVIADRGTVDIRNNGPAGLVQLNAAQIAGDVVKVGALGANGQLVINAGSQISANTSLKLYGGASNGRVLFTGAGDIAISGSQIDIAAKTVQIDSTTRVQNNGATRVHTDNALFGVGAGGGKFQNPVTQGPLSGAPPF